jgi:hypothetical protein
MDSANRLFLYYHTHYLILWKLWIYLFQDLCPQVDGSDGQRAHSWPDEGEQFCERKSEMSTALRSPDRDHDDDDIRFSK